MGENMWSKTGIDKVVNKMDEKISKCVQQFQKKTNLVLSRSVPDLLSHFRIILENLQNRSRFL